MSKTYIHYGYKQFDPQLFEIPTNRPWKNKPNGGLWASETDAPYGWEAWCKENEFRLCDKDNSFEFEIKDGANIVELNSIEDLDKIAFIIPDCRHSGIPSLPVDFEKMCHDGVDAIVFNISKDGRLYWRLYGWDCDCILVLNPEVIIPHNTTK